MGDGCLRVQRCYSGLCMRICVHGILGTKDVHRAFIPAGVCAIFFFFLVIVIINAYCRGARSRTIKMQAALSRGLQKAMKV